MTGLLTAAAVLLVLSLIASAAGTLGRATPADPNRRGPWGMLTRTSNRNRPLNPQERRWQTALIGGKDADTRWSDVVDEIRTLQRLASLPVSESVPDSYNARWLEQAVAELETTIDAKIVDTRTTDTRTTEDKP